MEQAKITSITNRLYSAYNLPPKSPLSCFHIRGTESLTRVEANDAPQELSLLSRWPNKAALDTGDCEI